MTDIASDLSVLIAEPRDVMVDLDAPVADVLSVGSSLDTAVAESYSLSADMEMRIRTEESRLLGINMQIESPWDHINTALLTYEDKFIRLQRLGDTADGVILSTPEIFILHRVDADSVVRCSTAPECENCTKPRRVIVAWNFYDQVEQDLRILVCDETLSRVMIRSVQSESVENRCVHVQNLGRPENSYRDLQYQFELTGRPENMLPGFFDRIHQLQLFDLRTLDVTKLVGSMI